MGARFLTCGSADVELALTSGAQRLFVYKFGGSTASLSVAMCGVLNTGPLETRNRGNTQVTSFTSKEQESHTQQCLEALSVPPDAAPSVTSSAANKARAPPQRIVELIQWGDVLNSKLAMDALEQWVVFGACPVASYSSCR